MCCLDIVRMIVSPRSAHSFRIPVIWHDVVVICELLVADGAYSGLLPHLAVQKLSHFSRRPEFPISSWVVRTFDALNSRSQEPGRGKGFPAAAGKRLVNRAEFIATKPHGIPTADTPPSIVQCRIVASNLETHAENHNSICFEGRRSGADLRRNARTNSLTSRESSPALMITDVSNCNDTSESGFTTTWSS